MPVRPSAARDLFEAELTFPADAATVVETVGDRELDAPGGPSVSVESVLARTDEPRFRTAAELHETVLANLGEDYVGRKKYDDRSSNHVRDDEETL